MKKIALGLLILGSFYSNAQETKINERKNYIEEINKQTFIGLKNS